MTQMKFLCIFLSEISQFTNELALLNYSIYCCSVAKLCPTFCDPMNCSTPDFPAFTISWSLLKLLFTGSLMPSNHLILCSPLFLVYSTWTSIRVFPKEVALHIRWPKYWSFSFSTSPYNEYSGLISFRTDRLDLFAVQKTPNGSTTIWKHQFFSAQPSLWPNSHTCCVHDYWKNHSFHYMDLCWWSDASASNTVYICHSFSSKEQESFNFVAEVTIHSDFGAQENKICHCFHFSPFYLQRSDRTRCHDLSFLNVVF